MSQACSGGADWQANRRNGAVLRACPGKVGTAFPIRICAKSTNLERIPIRPERDALRASDGLALAASPTFAIMALLTGLGADPAQVLCSAANVSPLTGMATMYLLMSAFHAAPWLKLIHARTLYWRRRRIR
jgi:hypothetical protein